MMELRGRIPDQYRQAADEIFGPPRLSGVLVMFSFMLVTLRPGLVWWGQGITWILTLTLVVVLGGRCFLRGVKARTR